MSRRTARQGIALLALVTLGIIGVQPAAAADRGHASHLANFWTALLDTVPGARVLAGWFQVTEKSSVPAPQDKTDQGWGIDPNGVVLNGVPVLQPRPTGSGS